MGGGEGGQLHFLQHLTSAMLISVVAPTDAPVARMEAAVMGLLFFCWGRGGHATLPAPQLRLFNGWRPAGCVLSASDGETDRAAAGAASRQEPLPAPPRRLNGNVGGRVARVCEQRPLQGGGRGGTDRWVGGRHSRRYMKVASVLDRWRRLLCMLRWQQTSPLNAIQRATELTAAALPPASQPARPP